MLIYWLDITFPCILFSPLSRTQSLSLLSTYLFCLPTHQSSIFHLLSVTYYLSSTYLPSIYLHLSFICHLSITYLSSICHLPVIYLSSTYLLSILYLFISSCLPSVCHLSSHLATERDCHRFYFLINTITLFSDVSLCNQSREASHALPPVRPQFLSPPWSRAQHEHATVISTLPCHQFLFFTSLLGLNSFHGNASLFTTIFLK